MKNIYSLIFGLGCLNASAQVSGTTIDHSTGSPIPYVNIWLKGKIHGTTSDKSGAFNLPSISTSDTVVFSAAGFISKEVVWNSGMSKVLMMKNIISLREVKLRNKKIKKAEVEIGKFSTKNIQQYWGSSNNPYQMGRFFPYHDSLKRVPFIKNIKMYLLSLKYGAVANVRLYEADENGCPENELHAENIFIYPRKGRRLAKVDISNLDLEFPKSGLVVAIEFMIIPDNRYEMKIAERKDTVHVGYSPSIGVVPAGIVHNSVSFQGGKWRKMTVPVYKAGDSRGRREDVEQGTFTVPAIMLTVSN